MKRLEESQKYFGCWAEQSLLLWIYNLRLYSPDSRILNFEFTFWIVKMEVAQASLDNDSDDVLETRD